MGWSAITSVFPVFVVVTSTLTDLKQKGTSDLVQWTEQCQVAFKKVKKALCGEILLLEPNFDLPMKASNRGMGAVCQQEACGARKRGTAR